MRYLSARNHLSRGFTIVELMISTVVFSIVLLVMTAGIIQIGRSFYKGLISSKTQETNRSISDEIGQAIQFSSSVPVTATSAPTVAGRTVKGICIGSRLYNYLEHEKLTSNHKFVSIDRPGCDASTVTLTVAQMDDPNLMTALAGLNPKELLGNSIRLAYFRVTPSVGSLYDVNIRVVYGEDTLVDSTVPDKAFCKTGNGSQFCAASEISTTVEKRLR